MSAYLKALYAAVAAGLGSLATILVGSESFAQVTDGQWVTVAIAILGAGAVVWGVPNTPAAPKTPVAAPTAVEPPPVAFVTPQLPPAL